MTQLYTPFMTQAGTNIGNALAQRGQNRLAGDAYMGKPGAMEQLMQLNPAVGIQIVEKQQAAEQLKVKQAATKQKNMQALAKDQRVFFEETMELGAQFDTFEEFQPFLEQRREMLRAEVGNIVDDLPPATPEMFEQAKKVYPKKLESKYTDVEEGISSDGQPIQMGINKATGKYEKIPLDGVGLKPEAPEGWKNITKSINKAGDVVFSGIDPKDGQLKQIPTDMIPVLTQGMEVTTADGTTVKVGGQQGNLAKTVQAGVEKDLLAAQEQLLQINDIEAKLNGDFQTFGKRAEMMGADFYSKMGGELDPKQEAELTSYSDFRADTGRLFSSILKEMSGAAVTPAEGKRAEEYLPNTGTGIFDGDSPVRMKAKVRNMKLFTTRATARLNFIRKNGLEITDIPLERMDSIMSKRGNEIEKSLVDAGMPIEEAEKQTRSKLAKEFGLSQ
jgi:hypothetical protein